MTPPGDVHPDSFGEAPLFGAGLMTPPGDLTEGLPRGRGFKGIRAHSEEWRPAVGLSGGVMRPAPNKNLGRGHETRADPLPPRLQLDRAVHLEGRDRCTTRGRQPQDGPRFEFQPKVFVPAMTAGMEQPDDFACDGIGTLDPIGFIEVAGSACQRRVGPSSGPLRDFGLICSTSKGKLKISSGGSAILATMAGPLGDERIEPVHRARLAAHRRGARSRRGARR